MTIPESPDLPGRWRILPHRSPRAAEDLRDCLVIRNEGFVLLTDSNGNLPADNAKALGLYRDDTRYLSLWTLEIAGAELLPILSNADLGFAMEQVFICPELVNERRETIPAGSVQVRRQRVLDNGLLETLRLENFAAVPISLDICFRFAGDFADIFEVRGLRRQKRGTISRPHVHADGITLRYQGLDGKGRQTRIQFDPAPQELSETAAFFKVDIPARGSARLTASVLADSLAGSASARTSIADLRAARENWREESTRIVTDNELVNAVLERSLADVWMLLTRDDELRFVSSGIPWFNTLFGRDSCLTALMLLPYSTAIARDTLRSLALLQGRQTDASREEEPGKIVHEMRRCETALTGEVPFRRYYGSVDSTPLFVLLAAEFYRWTGDLHLMKELLPAIEAALSWMDEYGDMDGDGYMEYIRRSPNGLDNQGWKDSHDAIIDERGDFLEPPIALVEVQGYVYAAKRSIAGVYAALGFDAVAARLLGDAERLRRRINRDFWLSEGYYGLALDGAKRLSRVVASNAGHLLWTGVPLPAQA
ncbi:MAG TPA: glycogen debranching N-terminal domain-containing protein, partial [Dehalococcoidia bacterium]|nr:glycogen debranching N-terminal domain-containing protein [Dehalococcoidia bacterium]